MRRALLLLLPLLAIPTVAASPASVAPEATTFHLEVLSNLIVSQVVATAEQILTNGPELEPVIVERARTQLRMVLVGALNWQSRR